MYSNEDIESAVVAQAISPQAAQALRDHVDNMRKTSAVDEESFRLLAGFNDIFVVIASLLLLGATFVLGGAYHRWLGGLLCAGVAWGLAEYFVRKRHMALPAVVLLLAFIVAIGSVPIYGYGIKDAVIRWIIAILLTALAALLHWRRFHIPITLAAGVGVVVWGVLSVFLMVFPVLENMMPKLIFGSGLLVFAFAMYWDVSDIQRQTRRADVAFWLHLLAAPMLVHPLFITMLGEGDVRLLNTLLVLIFYVLMAFFSLAIDRRALMVSALGYVLYAFTSLLDKSGFVSLSFAITALIAGSALLLLSAFWHQSRGFVLGLLPLSVCRYFPRCYPGRAGL
ncbi:hypothetical protein SK355_04930 [Candidatus Fukatsuia symbiotica]|uniref:DUF2157 domain-containing protein n=1 Tax=Candidatus Fukatsuia symbiotica TaxID=1878942 RepID=A0A2U8I5E2_9GAMM|nr:hypothetical protein [Candidatus Fukatsuia symbiotica]AWK14371.1 hypothetical protein CCS41_07605 [Candidatus Fukatsuia symbiotica]MEA9444636.1 hypothetical protein [Candidatus Fukatsuia symbiotica]